MAINLMTKASQACDHQHSSRHTDLLAADDTTPLRTSTSASGNAVFFRTMSDNRYVSSKGEILDCHGVGSG
jgi:hypothetical protein